MLEKTERAFTNEQSRDNGNIGHTRYRTNRILAYTIVQHWAHKTQDEPYIGIYNCSTFAIIHVPFMIVQNKREHLNIIMILLL